MIAMFTLVEAASTLEIHLAYISEGGEAINACDAIAHRFWG
ncbi:hypothetical protein FACS1894122_12460 [Alphaproteobacteria bacterium]|nr:hypothetical protein FACS1894122_12460 [Alphaproteobacteria bacterium]